MASLREIRGRIKGVKSTQQITRAMKMVAAAKLRRSQDRIFQARPYAYKMRDLLETVANKVDTSINPLLNTRASLRRVLVVCVTADRGLCGAFNTNVIKKTKQVVDVEFGELNRAGNVDMICIGRIGAEYFRKNHYRVIENFPGVFGRLQFDMAALISDTLATMYLSENVDKVIVIYNEFKTVLAQNLREETFLPITPAAHHDDLAHKGEMKAIEEYIYEPSPERIINELVPRHLAVQMWRVLLESNAAEQGARMTAMDAATENAKELLRLLNLSYNRARQAAITKEILEIVGGAEALKQSAE
ncbi:MAG: ATP synthase F1 subunit gamma [Rhizobacter sp.]|nr:ATP synthase F1 subunit gamma [Chlorobiales bacterium]